MLEIGVSLAYSCFSLKFKFSFLPIFFHIILIEEYDKQILLWSDIFHKVDQWQILDI